MERVESIKKVSKIIGAIGNVFQIFFGVITGLMLLICGILFLLRNELNRMIAEDHVYFNFRLMGSQTQKLADEGKVTEAVLVFALSMIVFSLLVTMIMHFITKIFKRFCNNYSPFLPEVVKDIKILAILITLLVLKIGRAHV